MQLAKIKVNLYISLKLERAIYWMLQHDGDLRLPSML